MKANLKTMSESDRPLGGKLIMITRARSQAGALADKLEALGAEVVEFPTIEIRPPENYAGLDAAIKNIHNYDWVIFTSVNGVEQFLGRARHLHEPMGDLQSSRFAAIGPETAKRLEAAGFRPCLVPQKFQAEGLLELLETESLRHKRVLIPRAAKARDILPETLKAWGAEVDVVEAYRTVIPSAHTADIQALLRQRKVDVITFTSSSTVANFKTHFEGQALSEALSDIAVACIGEITKKTVEDLGGRAHIVATESTIDGLVRAIVEYFAR
jgi:uroporphyrinogen III methyltransferase / synthase